MLDQWATIAEIVSSIAIVVTLDAPRRPLTDSPENQSLSGRFRAEFRR